MERGKEKVDEVSMRVKGKGDVCVHIVCASRFAEYVHTRIEIHVVLGVGLGADIIFSYTCARTFSMIGLISQFG